MRLPWPVMLFPVLTFLFLVVPEIDLWSSGLFFKPGQGFILSDIPLVRSLHVTIDQFGKLGGIALLALWAASFIPQLPRLIGKRRIIAYITLSLLLGPGLLVNGIFKDHWGRARPNQIELFGGSSHYSPPFIPSDQCDRNCSFVSGHAALGFFLITPAFFARRRKIWFAVGLLAGGLIGLMRMGQGGHFLSDIVFAFYAVYFTAWALALWVFRESGNKMGAAV
jgi:lipid A 4'-phosphatase